MLFGFFLLVHYDRVTDSGLRKMKSWSNRNTVPKEITEGICNRENDFTDTGKQVKK